MLVACLLTFLAALTAAVLTTPAPPNGIPQCARSECPVYTKLADLGPDMWKRRIEPGLWVRKLAPICKATAAIDLVYLDLHSYFTKNDIDRTTPIMLEISDNKARPTFCPDKSDSFPCCNKLYGLLFYIPAASQNNAPLPTKKSGVELLYMEEPRELFGITFSGQPITQNVTEKYNELTNHLDNQNIPFDDGAFIVASYDAPWQPEPHRNEVMVPIKKRTRNDGSRNQDGKDRKRGNQRRSVEDIPHANLIRFGI